jgi:SAM-dependent methyltransferase
MGGFYLRAFELLPGFLKCRIFPLDSSIQSYMLDVKPASGDGLVLDAGSGEGRFRGYFSNCRYLALDSQVGDSSWDYSNVDVAADLAAIPLPACSADLVLNIQVLEHVADPQEVVDEMFRVLKPGGKLLLTAPQGWHEHQQPNDFFRFTRFSLTPIFLRAGFSSVEVQPIGGYFHYLGHRLTYIPKILFQKRTAWLRVLLFPLELLSLAVFCFLSPLICYYLDFLDRDKEFTLCYKCVATKE